MRWSTALRLVVGRSVFATYGTWRKVARAIAGPVVVQVLFAVQMVVVSGAVSFMLPEGEDVALNEVLAPEPATDTLRDTEVPEAVEEPPYAELLEDAPLMARDMMTEALGTFARPVVVKTSPAQHEAWSRLERWGGPELLPAGPADTPEALSSRVEARELAGWYAWEGTAQDPLRGDLDVYRDDALALVVRSALSDGAVPAENLLVPVSQNRRSIDSKWSVLVCVGLLGALGMGSAIGSQLAPGPCVASQLRLRVSAVRLQALQLIEAVVMYALRVLTFLAIPALAAGLIVVWNAVAGATPAAGDASTADIWAPLGALWRERGPAPLLVAWYGCAFLQTGAGAVVISFVSRERRWLVFLAMAFAALPMALELYVGVPSAKVLAWSEALWWVPVWGAPAWLSWVAEAPRWGWGWGLVLLVQLVLGTGLLSLMRIALSCAAQNGGDWPATWAAWQACWEVR